MSTVDYPRIARWGSFYVAQWRAQSMWKWRRAIISYGLGNPVLYLASIGLGLGSIVDGRQGGGIDGVSYLVFLAPALLASAALMGGIEETTWPTLEGFVWGKQFRAIHAAPITGRQIALGVVWVSVLRTVVTVVLYWAVLLAFDAVAWSSALALTTMCVVAGVAFSAFMLAVTVRVRNDDAFMSLFYRFALMPLFLFSGTFYPLDTLSLAVRWIGWVSPLWHATELGRWLSYGHSVTGTMLAVHSAYLAAMLAGGIWFGVRGYERRLAS